jgi:nucleotide-binding universal stress UspA family protein
MYRKILTPIDLSEAELTQKGIVAAVEFAKVGKAQLRLVNVQPMMPLAFMDYVPADLDAQRHENVKAELAKVAERIDYPKELVSTALRFGTIYSEILAEAEAWGADLIVIGSHRPTMSTYLLGSNAKTVARRRSKAFFADGPYAMRSRGIGGSWRRTRLSHRNLARQRRGAGRAGEKRPGSKERDPGRMYSRAKVGRALADDPVKAQLINEVLTLDSAINSTWRFPRRR